MKRALCRRGKLVNVYNNYDVTSYGNSKEDEQIAHELLNSKYFKYAVDLGSLPEVVVKPSKKDKATFSHLREMLRYNDARHDFKYSPVFTVADGSERNEALSDNDIIDRLYTIYKMSGSPEISYHNSVSNYLGAGLERANYMPVINTMFLPNSDVNDRLYENEKIRQNKFDTNRKIYKHTYINQHQFIPELSHAFQYNSRYAKDYDKVGLPSDVKVHGKTGYQRPGHFEYDAHSIIEPNIYNYIHGNINFQDFISNIKGRVIPARKSLED